MDCLGSPCRTAAAENSGVTASQAKAASIATPQCREMSWDWGSLETRAERTAHCAAQWSALQSSWPWGV